MTDHLVSIVIVNWNHLPFLKSCLDAIIEQIYKPIEIVIIDNASSDGSPEWIRVNYPEIYIKCFEENRGFSVALNEAIRFNQAPFILSVNPDVVMNPDCLFYMMNTMLSDPKAGIVAPKLLRSDNNQLLDSTGLFINRRRCPYDRGQGEIDRGQYDHYRQVFGACGALALFRREMLDDLMIRNEYFDEDFFAYYEDADLAWRAQLYGWRAIFEPSAVGKHVRGWGDSMRKQRKKNPDGPRMALRNRYLMCVKNDDWKSFIADSPLIIASELPRLFYALFAMPAVFLGLIDFFKLYKTINKKRRELMQKVRINTSIYHPWLISTQDVY